MRPHQPTVLSLGAMALAFVSGIRDANAIQIRNCGFRESAISDAYTRAIALTAQAWKDLLDSPQTRAATSPRYLKAMLAYDSNEYWTFTDNTSTIEANLLTSNFTFDCSPPKGVCTSDEVYLDPMDQSHTMYLCNSPTSFFSLSSEEQAASIAARITQFQDVLGTQRGSFNRGLQYEYSYQVFIAATGNTDARMGPWTPMSARPSIEQYTATVLVPANGTATAIAECPIGPGITIKPYEPVLGAVWTVSSSDIHVYSSHAKAENFNNWDNNWEVKAYNTSSTVGTLTVTANCLSSNLGIKPTTGSNSGTTTKGSVTVTAPCPLGSISTGSGFSLLDATNTSAPALNAAITSLDIGSVR